MLKLFMTEKDKTHTDRKIQKQSSPTYKPNAYVDIFVFIFLFGLGSYVLFFLATIATASCRPGILCPIKFYFSIPITLYVFTSLLVGIFGTIVRTFDYFTHKKQPSFPKVVWLYLKLRKSLYILYILTTLVSILLLIISLFYPKQ